MKKTNKVLINNTIMMYVLSIAKLVIPLVSLPYLTRVLSVDCYGSISFVKSIVAYLQILVDFGFLLSGTKDIIAVMQNKEEERKKIGDTLYAQLLLCVLSIGIMCVCCFCFDILRGYEVFALLSVGTVVLSVFLFEYVFKAYEQMGKIAIRYVVMKVIALILTLIFVKSDKDIYLMPIFDILASLVAIVLVFMQLKKMGISCSFSFGRIKDALKSLKDSFVYFISNFATTAFSALNTLIIGLYLTKADVAYWTVALQMVNVVQALYSPITNSVFPTMIKEKNLKIIHKIMLIYMPLILCGCILILFLGNWAVELVFTADYLTSATLIKCLIPLLIVSFPAMLYGWPCLGAIDKQKATSVSTIISSLVQIAGLVLLIVIKQFTLINICIVRNVTECVFCSIRMVITYKNKGLFCSVNEIKEGVVNE